jgi:hypothetical protein
MMDGCAMAAFDRISDLRYGGQKTSDGMQHL